MLRRELPHGAAVFPSTHRRGLDLEATGLAATTTHLELAAARGGVRALVLVGACISVLKERRRGGGYDKTHQHQSA
jgi:hypothetical protein